MSTLFTLKRRALLGALALAVSGAMGAAHAADRVIRIVVPFGPGAVQDAVARTFSNELGQILGASVIVENRAGAGGSVGTNVVAKSAPDGNTMVLAAASHHLGGHLYTNLPYDPVKDFVGVSYLGLSGYVVGASAPSGIKTIKDLIDKAKSEPGKLNYASAGNGSASHLATALLAAKAGIEMQHIPTKSTGDAVTEVLSGRVEIVTGASVGMLAYQKDARINLLAYSGKERSRFLPDLPTVAESGIPDYAFDTWFGLLAPAGTPAAEIERINEAVGKALADPVVQKRLSGLGVEVGTMPAAQFQALLAKDAKSAGEIVKAAGARIE